MYCKNCGVANANNTNFCYNCGTNLQLKFIPKTIIKDNVTIEQRPFKEMKISQKFSFLICLILIVIIVATIVFYNYFPTLFYNFSI